MMNKMILSLVAALIIGSNLQAMENNLIDQMTVTQKTTLNLILARSVTVFRYSPSGFQGIFNLSMEDIQDIYDNNCVYCPSYNVAKKSWEPSQNAIVFGESDPKKACEKLKECDRFMSQYY